MMPQGNGTVPIVQVVVHNRNYQAKTEIENMIQKGNETEKEIEVMILMATEEETGSGRRVEAERGMIMIRIEAGTETETETETGEDAPNNISHASTPEVCNLNHLQIDM